MAQRQAAANQALRWQAKEGDATAKKNSENGFAMRASSEEFRPRSSKGSSRCYAEAGAGSGTALCFVPYLPQDDNGADAAEAQEVTDLLNKELSALLKMHPQDFWKQVASNDSLHGFLESYLLFRRRWYDVASTAAGMVSGDDELNRRVFMVLYRLSTDEEPGTPSGASAIVYEKKVFTASRILDICAIFGHLNTELTGRLVSNVSKFQSACLQSVSEVIPQASSTIDTLFERTSKMIERLSSKPNPKSSEELAQVVGFLHDTFMTLATFVEVYPPATGMFLPEDSDLGKSLLSSIASIHNELLPSVRKQLPVETTLQHLQGGLVKFSWNLLSGWFFEDAMITSVSGELFVQALTVLSHGSEGSGSSILQNLSNRFDLSGNVHRLLENGSFVLDDSLYAHLLALLPETQTNYFQGVQRPITTEPETEQDDAVHLSHISQVKDLFPDYGDGYISACLDVYDNNPELVIQHILEGTIHPDLLTLDVTLALKPKPLKDKVRSGIDKGKAKIEDVVGSSKGFDGDKRTSKAVDEKGKSKAIDTVQPENNRQGRFVRRNQDGEEKDAVKLLNQRDAGSSSQTARLAMQMIYDDEYDDSFDDLDANVGDAGVETDSLVNLVARRKSDDGSFTNKSSGGGDGLLVTPGNQKAGKGKGQEAPRFYVKDGKNYSYKVAGSVAVSSAEEAEELKKQQKELVHGLGRGGNVPVQHSAGRNQWKQKMVEDEDEEEDGDDEGRVDGQKQQQQEQQQSGRSYGRGYGRGRGKAPVPSKSHNRKDLSMKKHFSGLS